MHLYQNYIPYITRKIRPIIFILTFLVNVIFKKIINYFKEEILPHYPCYWLINLNMFGRAYLDVV